MSARLQYLALVLGLPGLCFGAGLALLFFACGGR